MNGNNITYRQQKSFCSKPGCRKCREGIGHGPYWYAYQVVNGRTVRTYIGKALPPGVQATAATPALPTPELHTGLLAFRLITLGQVRLEKRTGNEQWQTIAEPQKRQASARLLLCTLICSPKRQLTQQQVSSWLWPGLDARAAAQNLRQSCAALTQMLGTTYLKQTGTLLTLAGQTQFWVDSDAFEALLTQAQALPAEQKAARTSLLEQAIKLYGGDFLAEERVAEWFAERRTSLRRQWISALLALVDLYLDAQRAAPSIELLDQLLTSDPANEAAVQRLMFVLARQQRRVEAVEAYQRLVNLLRTTYRAAPSPETQALFQAIQQGNEPLFRPLLTAGGEAGVTSSGEQETGYSPQSELPQAAGEARLTAHAGSKQGHLTPPEIYTGRTNQSPLVGRDGELNALHQLLAQVEAMRGQREVEAGGVQALLREVRKTPRAHCMVLRGEAGIGKTRLAEESAREARRRGWTVIWSRAYQQEQGIPYRLWTAALRSVLTYIPNLARQATAFTSAAIYQPLRTLVPEMQETLVGAGLKSGSESPTYESLSPEQEELRLRDAVYTFLTTLSFTAPLLIVLDDIQWTDDSSAQMLGYLARRVADHPIALLATSRETELAANRVLNGLISHMQREQVVELLPVQPLSDEQIGALVSYLPMPAIIQVQHQAAGNPFFAEELAYSLQTSSAATTFFQQETQEETLVLPGSIAAALDQRLNRLSKECQDLLGKAAVLGASFDFELIAAMETGNTAGDDDAVLDLLDEALHAGVLTEEGGGAHVSYHFWHPLLASHLYYALSATRRARLHRRVAEALPLVHQTHESEEAATITQHLIKGGGDPARIARYAELAAHHAYSLFAYPEADRYYRIALNHLAPILLAPEEAIVLDQPLLPATPPQQRLYLALLVERLGECTRILGNFQDAPGFYLRALQLRPKLPLASARSAEERQEAQIQAMIWSEIAWIRRYTGDTAAAHACNTRGQETLLATGITDGPAWGCLRHQLASLYLQEGDHQAALQAELQALDLFTVCLARAALNGPDELPSNAQTRITRTLQGDPIDLGRSHNLLGIVYSTLGQLSEAIKHFQQAMTIFDQFERRRESANVCCNMGHAHLLKGEFDLARSFFQRSLSYAEQSSDTPVRSVTLYNLGELAASIAQFHEAEKFYHEALTLAAQMNDREYLSTWHTMLGELLQEMGRFKEAAEAIRQALSIGRAMSNQPCTGFALVALANLRVALVEHERAATTHHGQRALRHAATDLTRALGLHGLDAERRTRAHLAQARVSFLLGQFPQARQQGELAWNDAQVYELAVIQARCQQLLASLPPT
jgi:predicted ATPase/DNA-binding SARP family transcriptional activator